MLANDRRAGYDRRLPVLAVIMAPQNERDKEIRLRAWMNRQESLWLVPKHMTLGIWATLQRDLRFKVGSARDVFFVLMQALFFVATTCSPIWIKFLDQKALDWRLAITASAVLIVLSAGKSILTSIGTRRASRDRAFRLAVKFSGRLSKLWPAFKSLPDPSKCDLFDQVEAMLALVVDEAKAYLGDGVDSDLCANLWLFVDGHEKMKLAASTDNRPHYCFKASHMVAYHVAKAGIEYAMHDYHQLKKARIANQAPKFRSIFFMSLEVMPPAVDRHCSIGVLTITTSKPYRFWPSRSYGTLRAALAPHLSLLTLFLVNQHASESLPIDDPIGE